MLLISNIGRIELGEERLGTNLPNHMRLNQSKTCSYDHLLVAGSLSCTQICARLSLACLKGTSTFSILIFILISSNPSALNLNIMISSYRSKLKVFFIIFLNFDFIIAVFGMSLRLSNPIISQKATLLLNLI